jgi:hypothetical protein
MVGEPIVGRNAEATRLGNMREGVAGEMENDWWCEDGGGWMACGGRVRWKVAWSVGGE